MSEGKRDIHNPILFECAWEVANKVGGIYTVIKTKVPVTVSEFGDRYTLIGPLSYKSAPMEVEAEEPSDPHVAGTIESMRSQGVKILYGRWLIEGNPLVLLFDTGSVLSKLDEWKADLWNLAGIPSPPNDQETNDTIILGYLVAWFLGDVRPSSFLRPYPCSSAHLPLIVCFPAAKDRCHCPFPRMASRSRNPPMQEAPYRCHHRLHHSRNSPRSLPLRRIRRLLQQPPVL